MIRTLALWQRARWLRAQPGRAGLVALAFLPAVYLLPLHHFGMADEWAAGAWTIAFILPLPLAAILMRDSASVPPAAVWLYQKGIPLEDLFLARWLLDLGLLVLLCLWSAAGMLAGSVLYGELRLGWVGLAAMRGILAALPAAVLLFGLAGAGSRRGGDLLVLFAFLALLEPLLALFLPPVARTVLHAGMMPMLETAALARGPGDDPRAALHAALHLVVWTSAWLVLGCWRLRQWRPEVGVRT